MSNKIMNKFSYPRPIPLPVTIYIYYLIISLIGAAILILFYPGMISPPNAPHGPGDILLVFSLYPLLLIIWGFCTGRKWLLNLIFILTALSFLSALVMSNKVPHPALRLFLDILSIVILAFMYKKSSLAWFKQCKMVRVSRKSEGYKSKTKLLVILVSIVWVIGFFVAIGSFAHAHPIQDTPNQQTTS